MEQNFIVHMPEAKFPIDADAANKLAIAAVEKGVPEALHEGFLVIPVGWNRTSVHAAPEWVKFGEAHNVSTVYAFSLRPADSGGVDVCFRDVRALASFKQRTFFLAIKG